MLADVLGHYRSWQKAMADDFEAFNEQVETEPGIGEKESHASEEPEDPRFETTVSEVSVIGEENDRLKLRAETDKGANVEYEMDLDEAGRVMSVLDISDAQDLEGQTVLAWEDDNGEDHLEFEGSSA